MRLIKYLLLVVVLLVSCKKKEPKPENTPVVLKNGMLVLCEGLFQQNNSTVSWVDFSSGDIDNQFFQTKAGRMLGDTGNDIQRYGGKIYIIVNVSSTIEVLNASTFEPIEQISMIENNIAKQPRYIVFKNGKGYITCYDGYVDVLDTASLTITNRIKVGENPEGLTIVNHTLYVANSGGLSFPDVDSTLSVVDLVTETETMKITIGKNPGQVIADNQGDVYVITRGDYSTIPTAITRVSSQTNTVLEYLNINASEIEKKGDQFLIANYDFNTQTSNVSLFDPQTESVLNSSFIDNSGITTLYGITYNPINDKIYISDAMEFTNTGYIREYSSSGTYIQSYHVGLNPNNIVFYD